MTPMRGDPRLAPHVLLVEDEPAQRELLVYNLAADGFRDTEAADGEEGVSAAVENQPDVVLLDIAMPVMDGLQALPLILEQCPKTIVVMLSAFGPKYGLQHQAELLGAHGYILKGGRMKQVLDELRAIIDSVS